MDFLERMMKMWIRSQDGTELIKPESKDITNINIEPHLDEYSICANDKIIGWYDKFEHALFVMDSITNAIHNYEPNEVFRMPKKDNPWLQIGEERYKNERSENC